MTQLLRYISLSWRVQGFLRYFRSCSSSNPHRYWSALTCQLSILNSITSPHWISILDRRPSRRGCRNRHYHRRRCLFGYFSLFRHYLYVPKQDVLWRGVRRQSSTTKTLCSSARSGDASWRRVIYVHHHRATVHADYYRSFSIAGSALSNRRPLHQRSVSISSHLNRAHYCYRIAGVIAYVGT